LTPDEYARPLIEVFDDLLPEGTFADACALCASPRWRFGHESHDDDPIPFWEMDLTGDAVFNTVWEQVRARCEALSGRALRVIRQYAAGHTYGLGGKPHCDDHRSGCYTLLYYSMREWKQAWEGETVFYDSAGEVIRAVTPRPNRAVFFDSRIEHAGRAPSRLCPALRVIVAYKLEPQPLSALPAVETAKLPQESSELAMTEVSRIGAERVYSTRISGERLAALTRERLLEIGKGLHVPGFRPGKIPLDVLEQRYGARARDAVRNNFAVQAAQQLLRKGNLTSATQAADPPESGDLILHLTVTHLPALPNPPIESAALTRLTSEDATTQALLDTALHQQVLDRLDEVYRFPLAEVLVAQELVGIFASAKAHLALLTADERRAAEVELRAIGERRVRLGAVVLELARRYGIAVSDADAQAARAAGESRAQAHGRLTEQRVIGYLIGMTKVASRPASTDEVRALQEED